MSSAQTTEVFHCTPQEFFNIIVDFEKYPEFLPEVKECKVIQDQGNKKLVEFQISLIKNFSYRLWMNVDAPKKLSWSFDSGDLFKISNGHWELEDLGGKTKANYWVEAKFKVFVPGPIAKTLVNVNLPNMMNAYRKRVEKLYGQ